MEPHELEQLKVKLKNIKQTTGGYKVNRLRPFMLGEKTCITGNIQCPKTRVWQRGEVWLPDGTFMGDIFWRELNSEVEENSGQLDIKIN